VARDGLSEMVTPGSGLDWDPKLPPIVQDPEGLAIMFPLLTVPTCCCFWGMVLFCHWKSRP
jgi:hypothetical protein